MKLTSSLIKLPPMGQCLVSAFMFLLAAVSGRADYFTGFEDGPVPPVLGVPAISSVAMTSASVTVTYAENSAESITEYGFVYAETSLNPAPELGGDDVDLIDFAGFPFSPFGGSLSGLEVGTSYSLRAYLVYEGGTVYSSTVMFDTLSPLPVLDGVTSYFQDFSEFTGEGLLPAGWDLTANGSSATRFDYSEWGDTPTGLKYSTSEDDVFGYQHTGTTGVVEQILTLQNGTGEILDDLTISYYGRVSRITEGRTPSYSVTVNGASVPALAYSTSGDDDYALRIAAVSGLDVEPGGIITIIWTSDGSSAGSPGSGSRKQIGISDVTVAVGASVVPPSISFIELFGGSLTETGFGVDSEIGSDGGSSVTEKGFLIAETSLESEPTLETPNTTVTYNDSPFNFFFIDYEDLQPGTSYSVRSFASNSAGTTYSAVLVLTTLDPAPGLSSGETYQESFMTFTGVSSLPVGWIAESSLGVNNYAGDWGTGSAGGFRGPEPEAEEGVIGYQHTGSTGDLVITLRLINDTGAVINNLDVSYLGRVARVSETRHPAWVFAVDGMVVPELGYSTEAGVDQLIEGTVTGLSIPEGAVFELTWTSDRGFNAGGSSRQIGLANVSVSVPEGSFLAAPTVEPATGTYVDAFTVTVTSPDADVEFYYTLDGSEPTEESFLYTGPVSVTESLTFRVRAFSENPLFDPSPVVTRIYTLPLAVTALSQVANPELGVLYRIDSEIIVTFLDPTAFRNQAYFGDATGGIFVDDPNGFLNAPATLEVGDGVTGLIGVFSVFSDQLQFTPQISTGTVTSVGNDLAPVPVTLDQMLSDFLSYRYRLVSVDNVVFDDADGDLLFPAGDSLLAISDASGSGSFRVFYSTDYIGTVVPEGALKIVGIPNSQTAGNFLSARSLADITAAEPPSEETLEAYMALYGLFGTDAAPLANPSGDGVVNLLKYAFGGNPLVSDMAILPVSGVYEEGGVEYLAYVLHLGQPFVWEEASSTLWGSEMVLQIEESLNLTGWAPAQVVLVGSYPGGNIPAGSVVMFRTVLPLDELPTTFLQIVAEQLGF